MSVTAAQLFSRSARILGARVGTTGTVTVGMSTTTVVLTDLINQTGDNTNYAGQRLIFTNTAGDLHEALITTWVDVTGTATIVNQTVAPAASQPYIVIAREDYTLNEFRLALDKALNETPRSYRLVIPFTPLLNRYYLSQLAELTGAGDVDQAYATLSPLMLHNEDFSLWQDGPAGAPDGYTLTGTNATITRVTGGTRSNYAALITAGSTVARLTQTIPSSLTQWITRRTFPVYIQMRAAAWISTTDASSVRVFIHDGTTYHYSDYIDNDGVPQFPNLSLTPDADMTAFTWGVEIAATKSVRASWAGLMQNTVDFPSSFSIKDSGSQAFPYVEFDVNKRIRNVGGLPMIETPPPIPTTWGQLIVYVRRAFPVYSSDDDSYDDQYARVLTAGLLVFLLEPIKPEQNRGRLDIIRKQQQRIWTRMASNLTDLPVGAPIMRYDIVGS